MGEEWQWQSIPFTSLDTRTFDLKRAGQASAVVGKFIYLFGGRVRDTFYSDLHRFDTVKGAWDATFAVASGPITCRAYPSLTAVGDALWLFGGSNKKNCFEDVWVFDLNRLEWQGARFTGDVAALRRTAHGAVLHPTQPGCLLLHAGYGDSAQGNAPGDFRWLSDLLLVDTVRRTVVELSPLGSPAEPRAYHTFTAVGSRCYVFGGRQPRALGGGPVRGDGRTELLRDKQLVSLYDVPSNKWMVPGHITGVAPCPRSSPTAAPIGGAILLHGGATKVAGATVRMGDLHVLQIASSGRLSWWQPPTPSHPSCSPCGRAGHSLEVVAGRAFVLGGYGGNENEYAADMWWLQLPCAPADMPPPRQPAAAATSPARGDASCWRSTKRHRTIAGHVSPVRPAQPQQLACLPEIRSAPVLEGGGCVESVLLTASLPPAGPSGAHACLQQHVSMLQQQVHQLQADLASEQAQTARLAAQLRSSEQRWEQTAMDIQRNTQTVEHQAMQLQMAESACAKEKAVARSEAQARHSLEEALRVLEHKLATAEQHRRTQDASIDDLERKLSEARSKMKVDREDWEKRVDEAVQGREGLRKDKAMVEEKNVNLHRDLDQQKQAAGLAEGKARCAHEALQSERLDWAKEQEALQKALQREQEAHQAAQQQLKAAQQQANMAQDDKARAEAEAGRAKARVATLEEQVKSQRQHFQQYVDDCSARFNDGRQQMESWFRDSQRLCVEGKSKLDCL